MSKPLRPLIWPPLVEEIAAHLPTEAYLVGGIVRDTLRGRTSTDVDIVVPDSGLKLARLLADRLGGAYYPVDAERGTGRVVFDDGRGQIDVASYRGDTLEADLRGRDFTINAIAVDMRQRNTLIDPLGGQEDLLKHKIVRLCHEDSLTNDPLRTLRAVRMSLQFGLRIARETTAAIRHAQGLLSTENGPLHQPERTRDELLKITAKASPTAAFKVLNVLGTLDVILPNHTTSANLRLLEGFERLTKNISYQRDDNSAANVMFGVAVMILDRYRAELNTYLGQSFGDGSTRLSLTMLALLMPANRAQLGERLRLSGQQTRMLAGLDTAFAHGLLPDEPPTPRDIHRFFKVRGHEGVESVLLGLAAHTQNFQAEQWGPLLDDIAAPLLAGYFHAHEALIAPPPLVRGDTLQQAFSLPAGPIIGELLAALAEEQAAETVTTREQALTFVQKYLEDTNHDHNQQA